MEFRETRIHSHASAAEEQKNIVDREDTAHRKIAADREDTAHRKIAADREDAASRKIAADREDAEEDSTLRLSGIVEESIVDGPGIRFVVFVQGCPHRCPGCHNPGTHSFSGGYIDSVSSLLEKYRENPLLAGITFSGGEPFCQPAPLARLGAKIKALGGTVITYTGYLYEDLLERSESDKGIRALLEVTDLLVDGPYIEAERSLALTFRGSKNQRLIYLKEETVLRDTRAKLWKDFFI